MSRTSSLGYSSMPSSCWLGGIGCRRHVQVSRTEPGQWELLKVPDAFRAHYAYYEQQNSTDIGPIFGFVSGPAGLVENPFGRKKPNNYPIFAILSNADTKVSVARRFLKRTFPRNVHVFCDLI